MASKIPPTNYTTIQGWMITDLGLRGNDLLIYSIIYGFSQEEGNEFTGSLSYLQDWTGLTRTNVLAHLRSLVERGLLAKKDTPVGGGKLCSYTALKSSPKIGPVPKQDQSQNDTTSSPEIGPVGSPKIGHNNKGFTKSKKDCLCEGGADAPALNPQKEKRKKFVPPTPEELHDFCIQAGLAMCEPDFMDFFESNGWMVGRNKMKDWKAAARRWARRQAQFSRQELLQ